MGLGREEELELNQVENPGRPKNGRRLFSDQTDGGKLKSIDKDGNIADLEGATVSAVEKAKSDGRTSLTGEGRGITISSGGAGVVTVYGETSQLGYDYWSASHFGNHQTGNTFVRVLGVQFNIGTTTVDIGIGDRIGLPFIENGTAGENYTNQSVPGAPNGVRLDAVFLPPTAYVPPSTVLTVATGLPGVLEFVVPYSMDGEAEYGIWYTEWRHKTDYLGGIRTEANVAGIATKPLAINPTFFAEQLEVTNGYIWRP